QPPSPDVDAFGRGRASDLHRRGANRLQWRDRVGFAPTSRGRRGERQLSPGLYVKRVGHAAKAPLSCLTPQFLRNIQCSRTDSGHIPASREERMSKSSTVTIRETPVQDVASAKAGGLTIHGETFVVQTDQRIELVDLTSRVMEFVRR